MDLLLVKVSFIMHVLAVIWVLCAVILILVILIQKGRGGGLSGAFGGGMASGILGTKTGDFLTWVTVGLVTVFLLLSIVLAKFYRPTATAVAEEPPAQTMPVETPAEVPQTPAPEGIEIETEVQAPDMTDITDQNQN